MLMHDNATNVAEVLIRMIDGVYEYCLCRLSIKNRFMERREGRI